MKKCLVILLLFLSKVTFSQIVEEFNDRNLTNDPEWRGSNDANDFIVDTNERLQSNCIIANSNFYLSTASTLADNCSWEFLCNMKFKTSGSNYIDVYLTSDKSDLQANNIQGYFVRLGGTQDEISLYKRTGSKSGSVELIDGVDGVLDNDSTTVKIRVTRTSDNLFVLERDPGDGLFFKEGEVIDASVATSNYFGIFIQQSSSSFFNKHLFDDFRINILIPDTIPPKIVSAQVLDSVTIEVAFNESIDSLTGKTAANYSLSPSVGAFNVETTNDSRVYILHLTESLKTALYSLSITGIEDIEGNTLIPDSITYNYVKPYTSKKNDVIINEIFADPTPQVDLPSVEFIELWNTTEYDINLKDWKVQDKTTTFQFADDSIKANEFVILCAKADTAEFKKFGRVIGISPWPSLNNIGDSVTLVNQYGEIINDVNYNDTWYKENTKKSGGWSLERIDPLSKCQGPTTWLASRDSSGGTPGKGNSIYYKDYDSLTFKADSIHVTSDTSLIVYFNKPLGESTLSINPFHINPDAGSMTSAIRELNQVVVTFSQKFFAGTSYSLTIHSLKDCSGNIISSSSQLHFSTPPLPPVRPDTATLFITEIFADPSPEVGLPLSEFIEIYNPGSDTVDLQDWTVNDAATVTALKNTVILPQQYLILCRLADTALYKPFGRTVGISPWPALNNAADQIVLKSFTDRTVDSISYNDTWYKNDAKKSGGWTLERINTGAVCVGKQNWSASVHANGGTPGEKNSVLSAPTHEESLKLKEITNIDSVTLNITFNRTIDSLSAINPSNYTLNNGVGNPQSINILLDNMIQLKFRVPLTRGLMYHITASNITDCAGVLISADNTAEFLLPKKINKADILISEILFNPRVGGVDFVEIYNNAKDVLDLKDLQLATINENDSVINVKSLTVQSLIIKPQEYYVLTTNPDVVKTHYNTMNSSNFIRMTSLPAFNDDAGVIVLLANQNRIDQLNYSVQMHFKLIKAPEGVSLERSSFSRTANEPGNFRSAAATVGYATPGYKNSQSVEDVSTEEEVFLTSETFSPDNDGFEDVLEIKYQFTTADWVANTRIYTDKGALVKRLTKNTLLAASGTISWDGLDETNQKVPVGVYIIHMEIFNNAGQVKKYRRAFAVASKLN